MKELTYDRRTRRIVGVGRIEGPDLVTVPATEQLQAAIRDRDQGRASLSGAIWHVHKGVAMWLHEIVDNP